MLLRAGRTLAARTAYAPFLPSTLPRLVPSAGAKHPLFPAGFGCAGATPTSLHVRMFGVKRKSKADDADPAVDAAHTGRSSALAAALRQIESRFGKGAVIQLGQKAQFNPEWVISTGSLGIDRALGIGGLPKGRIIEIYGPESSGKTTIALQAIAEAQKKGLKCLFVDVEHALDPKYAGALGVVLDDLLVSQPASGEEALEITDTFVRSGAIDLVVVDSVAALIPKKEIEGDMGDANIALQARMMSQSLRKLLSSMHHSTKCSIIFLNQLRSKVGVLFGSPDITSGGNALKFYASVRMDIRKIGALKNSDDVMIGNRTRVKIVKNKVAPPFREAEFDMTFGKGVCKLGELVDLGTELGLLTKTGAWYSHTQSGTRLGQGKDKTKAHFAENPEEAAALEAQLREALLKADSGGEDAAVSVDASDAPPPDDEFLSEDITVQAQAAAAAAVDPQQP